MPEPTTTATATVGWAFTAGLLSAFLAAMGISWVVLFFAFAGAFVGAGFGPSNGRWRAIAIFPAVVLLAAKLGVLAAAAAGSVGSMTGDSLAQTMAGMVGLFFHPLTSAAVRLIPAVAALRLGVQPAATEDKTQ